MVDIERSVIKSFNLAKRDIYDLKGKVENLMDMQRELQKRLGGLRADEVKLYEMFHKKSPKKRAKAKAKKKKIIIKRHHAIYVAPRGGHKFHLRNCPFAQNIKPKNLIRFKSKTKALNKGFKPCTCIK